MPVLVVGVELAGVGEPLLDHPAAEGAESAVDGDPVRSRTGIDDRLGVRTQIVERQRRAVGVETGGLEHRPVVVEHRVREIERHRPLHPGDVVARQHRLAELRGVVTIGLDARPDRNHRLGVDRLLHVVLGEHHQIGTTVLTRLDVLVERLVVAALELELHAHRGLAGVVGLGQGLDGGVGLTGQAMPEQHFDGLIGGIQGADRAGRQGVQRRGRRRRRRRVRDDGGLAGRRGGVGRRRVAVRRLGGGGRRQRGRRGVAGVDDRFTAAAGRQGEGGDHEQSQSAVHPFTAPAVSPRTSCRWNTSSAAKIGTAAITVPAISRFGLSRVE